MLAIDEETDQLDAGFLIGLENKGRLLQECLKIIELERGYKYIYREHPTSTGRKLIRQKYFIPTDTWSQSKQDNRDKFGLGVAAWQALSMTEQIVWNKLKYPYHMAGYNRFLRAYMLDQL